MLVDEMPRSFVKKNNSYSHCPLKKRPVHVMLAEEAQTEPIKEELKEEVIEVVTDDPIPEPENLSTKPEDLSRTAEKYMHKTSLINSLPTSSPSTSPVATAMISTERTTSTIPKTTTASTPLRSPSPRQTRSPSPIVPHHHHNNNNHHHHVTQSVTNSFQIHHHHHLHRNYPVKSLTPPAGVVPVAVHPMAKKARVEVILHENSSSSSSSSSGQSGPMHFMGTGGSPSVAVSSGAVVPLEPLNLNTPVEPLARYATPAWARSAPLFPPHYLPYPAAYRYPSGAELYPAYPVPGSAGYPNSSPDHPSASPPPHTVLTCPTIQRPVARSYAPWASPDHCGLSPTSSLGSGSLRSPPPVTPEDLSSPGSDSGRSSAGSTSAGPIGGQKMDKNSSSPRYQCPDCGKSYSTYSGLSKHQQFHCAAAEGQTKKSFSCKYCEKVYVSLGALKMHIRTHTLPCKCHLCGKAFSRPWLLQGHIRTHTGEKPFSCQHCNRAFADRSNLRAHLQTHSDVKKYSCSSCSKTFSRMSLLTKHQEGGCPGVAVPMAYGC